MYEHPWVDLLMFAVASVAVPYAAVLVTIDLWWWRKRKQIAELKKALTELEREVAIFTVEEADRLRRPPMDTLAPSQRLASVSSTCAST